MLFFTPVFTLCTGSAAPFAATDGRPRSGLQISVSNPSAASGGGIRPGGRQGVQNGFRPPANGEPEANRDGSGSYASDAPAKRRSRSSGTPSEAGLRRCVTGFDTSRRSGAPGSTTHTGTPGRT